MTYNRYERERLRRRIDTLMKQGYEVGEFDGVEVAITILNHGRFSTFRSTDKDSWPPSIPEINKSFPVPVHYNPESIKERIARRAPQAAKMAAVSKMKSDLWVKYKSLSGKQAGREDALIYSFQKIMESGKEGVEQAQMDTHMDTEMEMNFLAGTPSEINSESSKEMSR